MQSRILSILDLHVNPRDKITRYYRTMQGICIHLRYDQYTEK